ncbi:MAG: radical SAM protein [Thermoplasmata archaeon]|jgi:radical SAM superfamily enzyme with C-terminal helix-hairpin-helix motif|nr:radical SAM protein [Thermoplasmata archaeon]
MKALVLDGYTDEPACLGVPPYVGPHVRLAYGALVRAGAEVAYSTVDRWRTGQVDPGAYDLVAVVRNVAVPGKYLRGMPASDRELASIADDVRGTSVAALGTTSRRLPAALSDAFDHVAGMDLDATLFDLVKDRTIGDRRRTVAEWNDWLLAGARLCEEHPDRGGPLIAEVQMYRGCVRYISGGCRFCVEPLFGDVVYRSPEDIVKETEALAAAGVRNIRLGAQSCVFCYMSKETGKSERPTPDPAAVRRLLVGVKNAMHPEVFHLDNANPAVVAAHPDESLEILKSVAEHCTSGNVLAFGLESADPAVARANNLNATAEETLEAVRLVNRVGAARGPTGLPMVLPGINFVCGLEGESKETYRLDIEFLRHVLEEGLMLRRINIRQVLPVRSDFPGVADRRGFESFKRAVRQDIDLPMLGRLLPDRTVLTRVYTELVEGGKTHGRQVGSYPMLVTLPYRTQVGRWLDVAVTGRGFRSVTGVEHPMDVNTATLSMLEAVPGIGRRRAMSLVRKRPFATKEEALGVFDETGARGSAEFHLTARSRSM